MSIGTIKLTNGSNAVVGTSTTFNTDLKSGDVISTTIGGVSYTLFVQTVTSSTAATLSDVFTGPTTTGAAYVAVPQQTLNRITASLAAQTSEAVRRILQDNANWQAFYSTAGDVTVTLPDGTPTGQQISGPSWSRMQTVIGNPLQLRGDIGTTANINTFSPTSAFVGIWGKLSSVGATIANGFPEEGAVGMLEVFPYNQYNGLQRYTVRGGKQYLRNLTGNFSVNGPWSDWLSVASSVSASKSLLDTENLNDLNTMARFGTYKVGGGTLANNYPYESFAGSIEVVQGYGNGAQQFAVSNYGNTFVRYMNSATTWSAWVNTGMAALPGFFSGNADTLLDDGDYPTTSATTGLPDPAIFGWTAWPNNCRLNVRTIRNNTSITQTFTVYSTSAAYNGRHFIRHKYSAGAWTSWRENLDESSIGALYGMGLSNTPVKDPFDFQQVDMVNGQCVLTTVGNWVNPPPGIALAANTNALIACELTMPNRLILRIISNATSGGNKSEYRVVVTGVKGARTPFVTQLFNSDSSTIIPLTNGGTGASSASTARSALGLGGSATLNVGTGAGTVAAGNDARIVNAIQGGSSASLKSIELSDETPFIDFHYGSSVEDFTSRLAARSVNNVTVMGATGGSAIFTVDGGYQTKQGIRGAYGGHGYNWYWNNTAMEMWIGTTSVGTVNLTATSDKLLKKDIAYQPISGALAEVCRWMPATFKFKARGVLPESREMLGFVANDLVDVSPECVAGNGLKEGWDEDKPDSPYTLDTTAMLAKAVMAIQELKREVDTLKAAMSLSESGSEPHAR